MQAARQTNPGPARLPEPGLERVHHHLTRHVLGRDRDLAQGPEVADHLRQRQHHVAGEAAQAADAQAAPPTSASSRSRSNETTAAKQRSVARLVDVPGLGPVQHLLDGLDGQVADALAPPR